MWIGSILLSLFLLPVMMTSAWAEGESEVWDSLRAQMFPDKVIEDGSHIMDINAPYRALDAALVPISVHFKQPQRDKNYISTLTLLIDENPSPLVGVFRMTPQTGMADIATRVRVDSYTHARAIAETSDGKVYMVSRFVKAAGGCSAPSLSDMDAAMARLGKMKMKFLENDKPGVKDLAYAQLLISHPNFSGLQFNQITRSEIPAHYVDTITIRRGDDTILEVEASISMSENPSLHFHYRSQGNDVLSATVTDSDGARFQQSWSRPG